MAYYDIKEHGERIVKVQKILAEKNLDLAFIYYDELNIGNGWYLTAWCPQFESGAVIVPAKGNPMIIGGPESEPFAIQDSAIKETRNLSVFMVPDEEYPNATIINFSQLFNELSKSNIKRAGIVGADQMPVSISKQIQENFKGVELVNITDDFLQLRQVKSRWEIEQIKSAFELCDYSFDAMAATIKPGIAEYEVAAAGEAAARKRGATSFAFKTIVGSGPRSNAVVPTAMDKIMLDGEWVMLGISPRWKGYSGVVGHTLPVSGKYTHSQSECIKHVIEVMNLTKAMLQPGKSGREIDAPGREYFIKQGFMKYLVCPFAHTIGIMEAEAPFFGPNSNDILVPGMTVCVDVSFFGHPEFNGLRVETGYEITKNGPVALSPKMDKLLLG